MIFFNMIILTNINWFQYRPIRPAAPGNTVSERANAGKLGTTPKQVDPPASILKNSESSKKSRGSFQTGPRPTARFVSPHESENDTAPSSPTSQVVIQPPSPVAQDTKLEKKTPILSGKKRAVFVASGRGKRPVAVRRQSSQSSTDSAARSIEAQLQSSADRTPPQFNDLARGKQRAPISSQDNSSSSSGVVERRARSGKKLELKHSSPRRPVLGNRKTSRDDASEAGPSGQARSSSKPLAAPEELTPEEIDELELQRQLLAEANARVKQPQQSFLEGNLALTENEHQASLRNISDGAAQSLLQRYSAVSSPEVSTTESRDANDKAINISRGDENQKLEASDRPSQNGLFSKRPVQSLTSTSIPESLGGLSRTKSQLTLLLEKDKATTERNQRSSSSIDLKGKRKA